ncbi:tetratricopeptide repeat protein [Alkalibacillus aidingensis]|uniref:tetratricopeptide repeat protein n=1 Tax=Alkalibacillus aidingensis TaxID=2747607 RepID=UPI00166165DF|nr:tetratricopeptide repeat protein [Alkalibacillus aidingensis]
MSELQKGIEYMQEHKFEEAAQAFNNYIEENPEDPVGYINFANLLVHLNEYDSAERFYRKSLDLEETPAAHYGLGNLYFEQDQFAEATKQFQEAMKQGLDDQDLYFMLGMSLLNQEMPKLALPYMQRASEISPKDVDIQFQYGLTLAYANMIDQALEQMNKVLSLDDHHSDAYYNKGVCYLYQEKPNDALVQFEQALAIQPDHLLAGNGKKQVEQLLRDQDS